MASTGFTSFFWFLAILAMIPIALWLLKRTPVGGSGNGAGAMRHVSTLPLSSQQRVVTVEVGTGEARRWLVLGVTQGSISTLHTMEPQGDAPQAGTPLPGFAQVLSRLRSGDRA
jgi:flagellar protein FliO/FliZ